MIRSKTKHGAKRRNNPGITSSGENISITLLPNSSEKNNIVHFMTSFIVDIIMKHLIICDGQCAQFIIN